jgi:hypothetical protein
MRKPVWPDIMLHTDPTWDRLVPYFIAFTPEPEFLNICWRLKSRLFMTSCLFKGHRVQQGSNRRSFCVLKEKIFVCISNKRLKVVQITLSRSVFLLKISADLFGNLALTLSASCHFKVFKISGSGCIEWTPITGFWRGRINRGGT